MSFSLNTRETRENARELKFPVTRERAEAIRLWARPRLTPDPHAAGESGDEYQTTSLYFDTDALDVNNRRGSYGRSKYRIRRYGTSDVVFVERKMRTSSMLIKRRTVVSIEGLRHLDEAPDREWPGFWFHQRMIARRLKPVCQVSYHRTARLGMTPYGPMRLTIDDGIVGRHVSALAFEPPTGAAVFEGQCVLELKFRAQMPVLFRHLIEEFALTPAPVSKYRGAMLALGSGAAAVAERASEARPSAENTGPVLGPRTSLA
jgi:hypothetical protein